MKSILLSSLGTSLVQFPSPGLRRGKRLVGPNRTYG